MCVQRAHEQGLAENGDAAIVRAAAHDELGRVDVAIHPEGPSGGGIERDDLVGPLRQIHDAVDHERGRLPASGGG